jgi:hypothetical protein
MYIGVALGVGFIILGICIFQLKDEQMGAEKFNLNSVWPFSKEHINRIYKWQWSVGLIFLGAVTIVMSFIQK